MLKKLKLGLINHFKQLKFRNKLIISYLVVIILPVTVLGVVSYNKSIETLNQQMTITLQNNLEQVSYGLANRMDKNNEFIRFTAFCPYVMEELSDADTQWYELTQKLNNYFEPLSWYNMSINRDFDKLTIYADYLSRPVGSFLQPSTEARKKGWYIAACGSPETQWFFEDRQLYAARRIYDVSHQRLIGVVHMRMNTHYLMNSVLNQQTGEHGFILTDKTGALLYDYSNIQNINGEQAYAEIQKDTKTNRIRLDGGDFFWGSVPVGNQGWRLYGYMPDSGYKQQVKSILGYTLLTISVCLIIMLFIIWLFSNTFVKRINKLNDKISQVESGNMDIEIHSNSTDEIGVLSNSFGRMLKRVNELIDRVYASEITRRKAELKSLQSQINPHFLYNALSLINWKALESDNLEISRITGLLSTFYRTCLNKGENAILVKIELDNIQAYINLQLIMHEHDFDVEYYIDPEVYPYHTVNFTLQPLVENAILHGIDENEGVRGHLTIKASMEGEQVVFSVIDNGVGMDNNTAAMLTTQESKGYGIKNVDERIKLFFGPEYGVTVTSEPGKGTTAVLRIAKQ